MRSYKLLALALALVLATVACLTSGEATQEAPTTDLEATQRALEATQNALSVPAEPTNTTAPVAPDVDDDVAPPPFEISPDLYIHPNGLFQLNPPLGWSLNEGSGSALFDSPDGVATINIQVTNTGVPLDATAFENFVYARESNFFSGFEGYTQSDISFDHASGSATAVKDVLFNGIPQTVFTLYNILDQAIFSFDFWANSDVFDTYTDQFNAVLDTATIYSDAAAQNISPYDWIIYFYGPGNLFMIEVPEAWTYMREVDDDYIVDTFVSPDNHALIENITYDDGLAYSKKDVSEITLELLRTYYTQDIVITDDQVQPDGSERLIWYSPSGGYSGVTFFELRGTTTILILTLMYDDPYEDVFADPLNNTIDTYTIP